MNNKSMIDLDDIEKLKDDWDGEGSFAPNRLSLDNARKFIKLWHDVYFEISLHSDGTIILENADLGYFRFLHDGTASILSPKFINQ